MSSVQPMHAEKSDIEIAVKPPDPESDSGIATVVIEREIRPEPGQSLDEAKHAAVEEAVDILRSTLQDLGAESTGEVVIQQLTEMAVVEKFTTEMPHTPTHKEHHRFPPVPQKVEGTFQRSAEEPVRSTIVETATPSALHITVPSASTPSTVEVTDTASTGVRHRRTHSELSLWLHEQCAPMLRDHNPLPPNPDHFQLCFDALRCPPHSGVAGYSTAALIIATVWGVLWSLFGQEAEPGGQVFALLALITLALIGGRLISLLKLPPLLGMLLVGLVLRNFTNVGDYINYSWASILRTIALVIIILRAGLALRTSVLKEKSGMIFRLSILPNVAEATLVAVLTHFILHLPWIWAFMLGFVFSATSAAIVAPAMIEMEQAGLGTVKGIPTVALAATVVDNVLSIAVFSILLGVSFSTVEFLENLSHAPLEILVGILCGIGWGLVLRYFPSTDQQAGNIIGARLVLLVGGGIIAVFGGRRIGYSGGGPLMACLIMALVAGTSWRGKSGWEKEKNPIAQVLDGIWVFFEAILFVLIGADIVLKNLDSRVMGWGFLILCIGIVVRCVFAYFSVTGGDLNHDERLFIALSWFSKATVQVTLGPMVLETARQLHAGPEAELVGSLILSLAVFAVLVTAPLDALVMRAAGHSLLGKASPEIDDEPQSLPLLGVEPGLPLTMRNPVNDESNL